MSEENIEVIRQILSEWERGDFGTGEYFDPDVHVRWMNPIFVHRSETRGLKELGQAMGEFLEAWDHVTARPEQIVEAGDDVVSVETWRARGRASGIVTEVRHSSHWKVDGAKVTYFANYGDPDAAFKAAGLSE
jgi:ketosteroid isomerase-like protein